MKIAISLDADKLLYFVPRIELKDEKGEDIHQLTQQEAETMLDNSNVDEYLSLNRIPPMVDILTKMIDHFCVRPA